MITSRTKIPRSAQRRRGQTLVETALMLIGVLIPVTVGILQMGIILNATNTLTQIAREGGRYAAVHGTELNSDDAIKNYVQSVAGNTSIRPTDIPDANITISMASIDPAWNTRTPVPARVSGNPINVRIKYPMGKKIFVPWMPFVSSLKGDYYAESTFVLE